MSPTKSSLRKLVNESLKSLSEQDKRSQSERVANLLWQHPKYKAAKGISLYLSTKNEIDTLSILKRALEVDEKRCFIPRVSRESGVKITGPRMSMIEIQSMSQYEALPVNHYGIKEPSQGVEAKAGDLDLVLVPGVAFSLDGRRLGHGKGYYDEFLAHFSSSRPANKPLHCIGLAFREQIVESTLAQDDHDYILDEVLVD